MSSYHIPVMLSQCIEGLLIDPKGTYIDATFGGGGHARAIIQQLTSGRLYGFDQDEDAAVNRFDDDRLIFVRANFRYLRNFMHHYGVSEVDGILADLGVSSHDFDQAERGFSFRFDAPLDMRMNQQAGMTAADVVNQYEEVPLLNLFRVYGEIPNARNLVRAIIGVRTISPIKTTTQLLEAIKGCVPRATEKKYLAQVFQALRIEVNDELGALREFLLSAFEILKPGGRLVVMTYHSLEDRLVKNFLKSGNLEGKIEKDFFGNVETPFVLLNRKVIVPSEQEIEENPRSRSARLRIAEKK